MKLAARHGMFLAAFELDCACMMVVQYPYCVPYSVCVCVCVCMCGVKIHYE